MGWLIFIMIYIVSFAIHIVMIYFDYKYILYKIGDIVDRIEFFMYCPIINTAFLIIVVIGKIVIKSIELLHLDELWESFRNIKIKKL